jgi:8-oxo-dGTP pyrophosphatase MutT (NUDIX family)
VKRAPTGREQYGAILIRRNDDGTVGVLLITSRETHRWVIPKGWPMRKRKPSEVAVIEAYEEAGVRGHIIGRRRLGHYHYRKMLPSGAEANLKVLVYPMAVDEQLDDWPERPERRTRWFSPPEAAALVAESGLARMIKRVPRVLARAKSQAARSTAERRG